MIDNTKECETREYLDQDNDRHDVLRAGVVILHDIFREKIEETLSASEVTIHPEKCHETDNPIDHPDLLD
jgi:hypothetical protein